MKKLLLLLAFFLASLSTSSASVLYVYVWNYNGTGNFYTLVTGNQYIGNNGYLYQLVCSGGPTAGTYYLGAEPLPDPTPYWVTAYPPIDSQGNFNNYTQQWPL